STRTLRVWAYPAPADLRKGFDGLCGLVTRLRQDPLAGDCFLFVNRLRTRAKVLLWDGTGLCVYHKRLEQGRFAALWAPDGAGTRALFGPSSERRGGGEPAEAPRVPAPPRRHGPRAQAALPLVEIVHTRPEEAAPCPQCGWTLEPWHDQYAEAEEIDVVERSFRIVRHRRQKYRCGCGGCIVTAPGPAKLVPG